MTEDFFDAATSRDDRSPDGFVEVLGVGSILLDPDEGRLVLTGKPNDPHRCDRRGCTSVSHRVADLSVEIDGGGLDG